MLFKDKKILVIGGTGSFGNAFIERLLILKNLKKIYVFSRDELKQHEMKNRFSDERLCYFIGDVRDYNRLLMAFKGIDFVIHAAALKQVPSCEFNPFEAVQTNIIGAQNIINAAIERKVKKVIALSTDKAVEPINLYGATKLCMEKLFISGNNYVGAQETIFSCVRYGNVIGSRGSVIPLWKQCEKNDSNFLLTDIDMTRFWLTLENAVDIVLYALGLMLGREIFIPLLKCVKMIDIAKTINPKRKIDIIGTRQGEKLHETLISSEEMKRTLNMGRNTLIILPDQSYFTKYNGGKFIGENAFKYSSNNAERLTKKELEEMI